MAGSLNRVQLIGNLGRDPDIKTFANGNKVANFSVACAESWKDRTTGEKKEKTEWVNVAVFGDGLIRVIEQYVHKGSKIFVEGKLQTRKWQDNSGNDRYSTEVVIQGFGGQIILLDSKRDGGGGQQGGGGGYDDGGGWGGGGSSGAAPSGSAGAGNRPGRFGQAFDSDLDDDVPF